MQLSFCVCSSNNFVWHQTELKLKFNAPPGERQVIDQQLKDLNYTVYGCHSKWTSRTEIYHISFELVAILKPSISLPPSHFHFHHRSHSHDEMLTAVHCSLRLEINGIYLDSSVTVVALIVNPIVLFCEKVYLKIFPILNAWLGKGFFKKLDTCLPLLPLHLSSSWTVMQGWVYCMTGLVRAAHHCGATGDR